ncbi:hypothetical protein Tco_0145173 [Tanacetum coccineum]
MAFPYLQERVAAQNSNNLSDAISVYIERKINDDPIMLSWGDKSSLRGFVLLSPNTESALEVVDKKYDCESTMIPLVDSDFVPLDPRLRLKKSAMDKSFSRGSIMEADNVKTLHSCNCLLLCDGSGMLVFDYVYNPSTNEYKKLPYPYCSLDNSPYYSSAGLRIAFDPTKSQHYKLVDAGRTFCWPIRSTVRSIILGEREQDSFLVINLSGKVIQYNLISKTLHEIYDCGSNQLDDNHDDDDDDDDDDELLQQFRLKQ